MAIPKYEKQAVEPSPEFAVQTDWLKLYRPESVQPVIADVPADNDLRTPTQHDEQDVSSLVQDPEIKRFIDTSRSHSTIAREGLEKVAAINPKVDVNETHQVIREAQAHRLQKIIHHFRPHIKSK